SARGSGRGSGWPSGGLVVAGRVEGELAEQVAGGGVNDPDVQVLDQEQDVGSGVGPANADVVELAAIAEGGAAGRVGDVAAGAVVGVGGPGAGCGRGPGGVGGGRGLAVRQGPVRPLGVVVAGEGVQEGLELADGAGLGWLGGQPLLQGLPEPLGLALG